MCKNIFHVSTQYHPILYSFLKKNLEDLSPFCGAIDTPVLDYGDVCPGFQSQGRSLTCFLTCVILRFTSGVTPADCIEVSMAAKSFQFMYLQTCPQALAEVHFSNSWPSMWWAQRCIPFGHSGSALHFVLLKAILIWVLPYISKAMR